MKDFVLEQFSHSELSTVNQMIERAKEACVSFISSGIEQTMNQFNTKPKKKHHNSPCLLFGIHIQ